MQVYRRCIKRGIDVAASALGLLCLSPVLAAITVWLHFANRGAGAFFRQERPGLHGKIFRLVKFKSMTDDKDASGRLLPNELRITSAGKFVRKTSLDELPQLWNVLRGDMSLIGPRPLLKQYLPWYDEQEMHRHDVRPGITGWAQVNGRNKESWHDRFLHDLEYVNNVSFLFDVKIVWLTIKNVITHKDIDILSSERNFDKVRRKEIELGLKKKRIM